MRPREQAVWQPISVFSAVVIMLCMAFLLAWATAILPTYVKLFRDFGGPLPALTVLALKPVTSYAVLALLGGASATGAVRPRERAVIWSLTAGAGLTCSIGLVAAIYLPIIELSASVR